MRASTKPLISVIIPVHNGGQMFAKCLEALAESEPPPFEIIVVCDDDPSGSGQLAEEYGATVTETPVRSGPAFARNIGSRLATGDVLLFMDADVAVRRDTVGQVAAMMAEEPDLTAIIGSYDDEPGATNFLSQYRNLLHHFVHQTAKEQASTFWGACGAIRRQAFVDAGGFNRCFDKPSIEDIELGYRLTGEGHRIRLCKELQVKHLKRWDPVLMVRTDFFQRALPWTELILRNAGFVNDLNVTLASRASVVLVYALLAALVAAWLWPGLLILAGLAALGLLALNARLYAFFWRKRGLWFALGTIPWHWLYYVYSGLAFAVGTVRHYVRGRGTM